MKLILLCLLFVFELEATDTRWTRVLTYTDNYENGSVTGKIITIISESGDKGRIDSRNNPAKHPENKTIEKDQDILLYDFSKQQKTILNAKMNIANRQSLVAEDQKYLELLQKTGSMITIENLGTEKIGGFTCIHYVVGTVAPKLKAPANPKKNNIWITKDLGNSNIWYAGPNLNYVKGSYLQRKLAEAGAFGVVVKWQYGTAEATLTDQQQRVLPSSTFDIPSGYSKRGP